MSSLQEISHRVYIAGNVIQAIQNHKKSFIVYEEPEVIEIVIFVLQNMTKTSFLKLSDHKVYIIL